MKTKKKWWMRYWLDPHSIQTLLEPFDWLHCCSSIIVTLLPKLIVDRSLSCGRCRLHIYTWWYSCLECWLYTQWFVFNLFWRGVEFATLLMIIVLGYFWQKLQQVLSNDTILMIMVGILKHTQTYTYWYSLHFLLSQYWLH